MKNLVQRMVSSTLALGLAACLGTSEDPERKGSSTPQIPVEYCNSVGISSNVDHTAIPWDRAYFQAIDRFDEAGNILLFYLKFEFDCRDNKGKTVVNVLSPDEVRGLGIENKQQLRDYLKEKVESFSGYLGPNLML
ncbi:MAG TPA: hypothetical protein VJI15_02525 [Candidatus Nanoarchaeia archaeon]|nr:hypothetical protein [Candidatus Nanoarchaeia archaeon]